MAGTTTYFRDQGTLEAGKIKLDMTVVLDASGDISSFTRRKGIMSLTHDSLGQYTITLQDTFKDLINVAISFQKTTDIAVRFQVATNTVSTTRTVVLRFYNLSSPANLADPVSCTMRVELTLKELNY